MKYINQSFYQVLIAINAFLFIIILDAYDETSICIMVGYFAISFAIFSLNAYLFFLKNVDIDVDDSGESVSLYYKKKLRQTYHASEIRTNENKQTYVLGKHIIISLGIMNLVQIKKNMAADLNALKDVKIMNNNDLFLFILRNNGYFMWSIVAVLSLPLCSIASQL